jgi:hypothetical protein
MAVIRRVVSVVAEMRKIGYVSTDDVHLSPNDTRLC